MTTTWNPGVHLKHAWSNLTTIWGKIALVLFYSFIWLIILSCFITLIAPGSQGMGCIIDVGGLHLKNVAFVALFTIVTVGISFGTTIQMENADAIKYQAIEDCVTPYSRLLWVSTAWILVTLLFTFLEEKLGDQGTEEERQPLSS